MKIVKAEAFHIALPYTYGGPLAKADSLPWRKMEAVLVKVTTDNGLIGWGEGFGFATCAVTKFAFDKAVAPLVLNRDPRDIAKLRDELDHKLHNCNRNGHVSFAISALDIALWDIAGKIAGKPLYQLLGVDETIERMPAYASLLRYGTPDLVREKSAEAVARGFKRIKLHEITVETVAAAREAIGPEIPLMVDTNCGWVAPEALEMAKAFKPYDLTWLEEPVWPPEDYTGTEAVRASGVPTAAGETANTFYDYQQLIDVAKVDYVQPSVTKIGGVSSMRDVIAYAQKRGTKVAPHSPYLGGPGLIATLHLCASMPDRPPIERYYCELEASPLGAQIEPRDGFFTLPNSPGLGIEVDEAVIAKYLVT